MPAISGIGYKIILQSLPDPNNSLFEIGLLSGQELIPLEPSCGIFDGPNTYIWVNQGRENIFAYLKISPKDTNQEVFPYTLTIQYDSAFYYGSTSYMEFFTLDMEGVVDDGKKNNHNFASCSLEFDDLFK